MDKISEFSTVCIHESMLLFRTRDSFVLTAFYVTHLMGDCLWISERGSTWFRIVITEAYGQYTFNLRFLFSPEFLPAAKPPSDTPVLEPDWWRATCGERCELQERDRRPVLCECSEIQFFNFSNFKRFKLYWRKFYFHGILLTKSEIVMMLFAIIFNLEIFEK